MGERSAHRGRPAEVSRPHAAEVSKPHATKEQKIADFGRFFGEKSDSDGAGKDFGMEKSGVKKSWKNREKLPIFSKMSDFCRFFGT